MVEPVGVSLPPLPEDWDRVLCVAAHPDDLEYGAAMAVARWTSHGKDVRYLLVTRGEAGIAGRHPDEVGPLRAEEERVGAREVGVEIVEFLDHADGVLSYGLDLRRDLARAIRRHRPGVVVTINHHASFGGPGVNHADHRVTGWALLDAVRDAANPWVFPELAQEGLEAWEGVRFAAIHASPRATHGVDVTGHVEAGIRSLEAHAVYFAGLGDGFDPRSFLTSQATDGGARLGVTHAVLFELIPFG